jgi:hypothetical protein
MESANEHRRDVGDIVMLDWCLLILSTALWEHLDSYTVRPLRTIRECTYGQRDSTYASCGCGNHARFENVMNLIGFVYL